MSQRIELPGPHPVGSVQMGIWICFYWQTGCLPDQLRLRLQLCQSGIEGKIAEPVSWRTGWEIFRGVFPKTLGSGPWLRCCGGISIWGYSRHFVSIFAPKSYVFGHKANNLVEPNSHQFPILGLFFGYRSPGHIFQTMWKLG